MRARVVSLTSAALLLAGLAGGQPARGLRDRPPVEDRFLNAPLPDIELTTSTGDRRSLSSMTRGQPLLLTFVFTRCAGVCSPFLASWRAADRSLSSSRPLQRLVLSFDRRDTSDDMATLAHHLGIDAKQGWTFAVASPDDVQRLADATGFWYDWDESRTQFDHPAMIVAARDGRLVRLLVGGSVTPRRLDDLVREARGEFVASYPLPGRVRFRCVQFDEATGRVRLDWGVLLLLVPVVACTIVTTAMFRAGRSRRTSTPNTDSQLALRTAAGGRCVKNVGAPSSSRRAPSAFLRRPAAGTGAGAVNVDRSCADGAGPPLRRPASGTPGSSEACCSSQS